ncbi:DUF2784 domain-containing protein [Virgisporangium ochraceum]|uniref:DUF2784 domain-containing protein n=1 Tax=Virgisporangium ochraceum TaxID=65505 RepID=A0A8J3ZTN0_9ACTN|nr:DUF2784 domain-containing protein [Virgisporangium ochraceum]GIJ69451.1 hypothetical protein Voc01_043680 [Virgisporangium ochraceum]
MDVLVTVILVVHFGYLAFVVVGGFLAWRWPRMFWVHLAAAAWGLAVVGIPLTCPLTTAENWARREAGQTEQTAGFIDRYIEGVLYPERYTLPLQVLVGVTVVGSWVGAYLYRRHLRRRVETVSL